MSPILVIGLGFILIATGLTIFTVMRLARKHPESQQKYQNIPTGSERDALTQALFIRQQCPDCHSPLKKFLGGPKGGMSQNVLCSGCHSEFNICPPFFAERISEPKMGRKNMYLSPAVLGMPQVPLQVSHLVPNRERFDLLDAKYQDGVQAILRTRSAEWTSAMSLPKPTKSDSCCEQAKNHLLCWLGSDPHGHPVTRWGYKYPDHTHIHHPFNYCPFCGAKLPANSISPPKLVPWDRFQCKNPL